MSGNNIFFGKLICQDEEMMNSNSA